VIRLLAQTFCDLPLRRPERHLSLNFDKLNILETIAVVFLNFCNTKSWFLFYLAYKQSQNIIWWL